MSKTSNKPINKNRQLLMFFVKFFIASTILLILWIPIGKIYQSAILAISTIFLILMGFGTAHIASLELTNAYLFNFNLVSFLALVIATPKVNLLKRLKILLIGLIMLFLIHVIDLVAHFPMYFNNSEFAAFIVYSIGVMGIAAPFLLWFAMSYREFFGLDERKTENKGKVYHSKK